ncbi:hypothetical protein CGMCC3_g5716 [Colletotrichum fructicola]|nr:uncharacterized protein CGMCC3_g5716 [Colletotrichum fructicola]KAE9578329.1 hypothetical protein CGMCC3_g5716 [Colletotrichum fructicola]
MKGSTPLVAFEPSSRPGAALCCVQGPITITIPRAIVGLRAGYAHHFNTMS